ncbi:RDD family protein [Spongiactinospora rosea]|uniref:RDD family protein n=1 Tax=Spongiactinospora rosea TaxID=2248750 RepID=A0A366M1Z3_9ACTN|nr:RDD family protein [Spongiactinospora rosea]RBQ20196.1 RDD family protein [Spongiactinospora rosea]
MTTRQGPRWTQSLLIGIRGDDSEDRGSGLGLPAKGPGSVASWPRRIGAIMIDWMICTWAIAQGLLRLPAIDYPLAGLGVFAVTCLLLIGTMGMTFGMRLTGIRVAALDGGRPAFVPVVVRTLLLCLAVPALVWDRDRRGLHDRAAGTVVVHL